MIDADDGADADDDGALLAVVGLFLGAAGVATAALMRRGRAALPGAASRFPGATLLPQLRAGAFDLPGRPGAAVRIPPGYRADRPLDLAMYFHGHNGCVTTLVGSTPRPCRESGQRRNPSRLAEQLDASGANAILVMPQLSFEAASGAPGRLGRAGGMAAFLTEVLGHIAPAIGPRQFADVRRVSFMGHSGGYYAIAAALRAGDLGDRVVEVALLDALYGEGTTFDGWVARRRAAGQRFRYANFYTSGTADECRAQRARLGGAAGDDVARVDPTGGYGAPVLIQRSSFDHGGVSREYPRRLWSPWVFDPR